ncbi:MAG: hypothetical protein LC127_05020, partial [Chitinophagales bacterium]|nr:hypothetical protein [Chitinophagales bacterium]
GSVYDPPVEGAAQFIFDCLMVKGWSVFVMSTREPDQIKEWMENTLFEGKEMPFKITILSSKARFWNAKKNIGITNRKIAAHVYIDDRGMRFEGSFEGMLEQLEVMKTWQGK